MIRINSKAEYDAVVIGAGFYGSAISVYLAQKRGFQNILIIEQESKIMSRASFNNQARVHNGYHYPRSFTTAYRSRINFPKFVSDWPDVTFKNFTNLYAIGRNNSKVTAKQFERFCNEIGAKIEPASQEHQKLFSNDLIEKTFYAEEYAFDAEKLSRWVQDQLQKLKVEVSLNTVARAIRYNTYNSRIKVLVHTIEHGECEISTQRVFNCAYSGLNQLGGDFAGTITKLKQEITELALLELPAHLKGLGITVMDGPFFSMMPFPARNLHTLSHVRYTPHANWSDEKLTNPYDKLRLYEKQTRVDRMLRDASRYLPSIREANYIESLFEIKTVLMKNEIDDARPILFERHAELPGCFSILGGKIDNIYDVLEKLDVEPL